MQTIKEYVRPSTPEEAWRLNQKRSSRVIGGRMWVRLEHNPIGTLIDLGGLGLDKIEETEDAFRIGAMVSLRALEKHEGLNAYSCGAVRAAVEHIVGVQFRNMATLGGSIAGRFGFSDVLTVFMAMDCEVELFGTGAGGNSKQAGQTGKAEQAAPQAYKLPLAAFAEKGAGRDLVTGLIIHKIPAAYVYQSVRRSATDFPVLTLAGRLQTGDAEPWCFAVGARPYRAKCIGDPEGLLKGLCGPADAAQTEEAIGDYTEWVREQLKTSSSLRGSAEYRTHLIGVLTSRAIRQLLEMQAADQADLKCGRKEEGAC